MKFLSLLILILLSITIYSADCDTVIPDKKDGGCLIGEGDSGDLITCLINAKTDKETKKCHQQEKSRKCKKISEKFKKVKNLETECSLFYSSEKIDCLMKAKIFDECQKKEKK